MAVCGVLRHVSGIAGALIGIVHARLARTPNDEVHARPGVKPVHSVADRPAVHDGDAWRVIVLVAAVGSAPAGPGRVE